MKPPYLVITLLFSVIICCKDSKSKTDRQKSSVNDTVVTINLLTEMVIQQLNAGRSTFDTTLLVDSMESELRYEKVKFAGINKEQVVVNFYGRHMFPLLILQKDKTTWSCKQIIYRIGLVPAPNDSPYMIRDFNWDGVDDIGLSWSYSAGTCNCSGFGCIDLYLYDKGGDSLTRFINIPDHLEVGISDRQKAIYFGNHCGGQYAKYAWQHNQLIKQEEYVFDPKDAAYLKEDTCVRTFYKYEGEKIVLTRKARACALPKEWDKLFY